MLPLGLDDQQGEDDPPGPNILAEVSLKSFTATPSNIAAFGASVISWSVTGPSGFAVRLNSINVAKSGQSVVQPPISTSYRLSAHSGQASRTLGTVQVTVDQSSCETWEILNPRAKIAIRLPVWIANTDGLYLQQPLLGLPNMIVKFSPGTIHVWLHLGKSISYVPDPSIKIDARFGLAVRHGAMEAIGEQISVDISFPWYVSAVLGIPLALALAMAQDSAIKDVHRLVQGIVEILNASIQPIPAGKQLSMVRVDDGNNGAGLIEVTLCSNDLLRRLAEISENVILT